MDIKIADVIAPSPAQVKKNIFGTINIEICADDGTTVVRLNGITVKKSKDGTRFLAMPSFKIGQEDNEKWLHHYTLFPNKNDDSPLTQKQRARMDKLTIDAMRLLDSGGTKRTDNTAKPTAAASTTTKKQEPWDA